MTKSIKIGSKKKSVKIGFVGPKIQKVRVLRFQNIAGRNLRQIGLWRISILIST